MVELPDDTIEQALVEGFGQARWDAMNGAEQHDARDLFGPMAVSIAARVRAEALSAVSGDEAAMSGLRNAIVLAALGGGRVGEAIDTFAVAVRARAVAGERQRALVEAADEVHREQQTMREHQALGFDSAGRLAILENLLRARARAAGSVPVAASEPIARDERPHSRACGLRQHEHGSACAVDCPTCAAGGGWHYPVATPPACTTCDGCGAVYIEGQIGVPGIGGWWSCPDCRPTPSVQLDEDDAPVEPPVATPTEPDHDMLDDVDRLRSMWRESPGTRAYVEDRYPGLAHAIERAVMHEAASPVAAVQPPAGQCAACDGSGRCSDLRCQCLTDLCHACGGDGRSASPAGQQEER